MAAVPMGNICEKKKKTLFHFVSPIFGIACCRLASIRPSLYPSETIVFCFPSELYCTDLWGFPLPQLLS